MLKNAGRGILVALFAAMSVSSAYGGNLDTLRFISSDTERAEELTDLLHHYYDPAANRSGATLTNSGTMSWMNLVNLGNLPLGTIGTQDLVFLSNFGLQISRLDSEGYVFEIFGNPFWPFPSYDHSQGDLSGWEFNTGSTEGWTVVNGTTTTFQNGRWILSLEDPDPRLRSPTVSIDSEDAPFIELRYRCLDFGEDCASGVGQLFWSRSDAPGWSETRSTFFPLVPAAENPGVDMLTYAIPVYEHPEWTGTITGIRVDPVPNGQVGRTLEVDRMLFTYDARLSTTNVNYVLSVAQYYFSSGSSNVFTTNSTPDGTLFDRIRKAMNYIKTEMGGGANNFVKLDWPGHDALPGRVGGQIQRGQGIQSGFASDAWPVGNEDAYASVYYYAALRAMASLEREVLKNPGWGVAPNPFGESATTYDEMADDVKEAIASNFWLLAEQRLMSARDINNVVRDVGHVGVNLEAIFYGAVDDTKADAIMDWVAGDRIVAGDDSQGADIYTWDFGPRTNTKDAQDWYVWPMYIWFGINLTNGPGALFDQQVANGGGWFWYSFYDLVSRINHRGSDDAWGRLTEILDWFNATQAAGGFVSYYASNPGVLQGCGSAGSLGLDCEFIENALVPLAGLYGFLGYNVGENGLVLGPSLPSNLTMFGVERLHFRKHFYTVKAFSSVAAPLTIETYPDTGIPGYQNSAHQLPIQLERLQPGTSYLIRVTNTDTSATSTLAVGSNSQGVVTATVAMPANGIIEVEVGGNAVIFFDGFETGDTSAWDDTDP